MAKRRNPVKRRARRAALYFSIWFLATAAVLVADGLRTRIGPADAALIFGTKAYADGRPSRKLQARLDKGFELYQKQFVGLLIVSGGVGSSGVDEAKVMRDYLVAKGVPAEKIITDSAGTSTYHTAKNTARLLEEKKLHSVIVVSQYFHLTRARTALKRCGVSPVYSVAADGFGLTDLYGTAREVPAIYFYLVRPYR